MPLKAIFSKHLFCILHENQNCHDKGELLAIPVWKWETRSSKMKSVLLLWDFFKKNKARLGIFLGFFLFDFFGGFLKKAAGWDQCNRVLYSEVKWTNYLVTIIYSMSVLFLVLKVNATVSSAARCSWMPWSTKWSNANIQEVLLKSPLCAPDSMTNWKWSFTSSWQFGQPVWLWSFYLYQPFSFLAALNIDNTELVCLRTQTFSLGSLLDLKRIILME